MDFHCPDIKMEIDGVMEIEESKPVISDAGSYTMIDSVCDCVLCYLLIKDFSSLNIAEKLQIITVKGRPKPQMKNLTSLKKNSTRHVPTHLYEMYTWLTGCKAKGKLFCWPCLLFVSEKGEWNKTGMSDSSNLHKSLKKHMVSKSHLQAVIKQRLFVKMKIEHTIDKQLEMGHQKYNEQVNKNREILKRLIDVVCFLGQHEWGFRRRRDESSVANFEDMLALLAKYDMCLQNYLEQSSVFRAAWDRIQDDLISSLASLILKQIKCEVKRAKFIAVSLEETLGEAAVSSLVAVVRYIQPDGSVQERFLGFRNVDGDRTAHALQAVLADVVQEVGGEAKLIAQSYDGAAVKPGQLGILRDKVRKLYPSALFVHSPAHDLNVVLVKSVDHIKECRTFFAMVGGLVDFFSKSTKRTQALDTIIQIRSPGAAPSNWKFDGGLLIRLSEYRESLIELFGHIIEDNDAWDTKEIILSRGFLDYLKRDASFKYMLDVFSEVFPFADDFFNGTDEIASRVKQIDDFKSLLSRKHDEFDQFWDALVNMKVEVGDKILSGEEAEDVRTGEKLLFHDIIDHVQREIDCRFSSLSDLKFLTLCNFDAFKGLQFPDEELKSLSIHYSKFFDGASLRAELAVIYDSDDVRAINAKELMQFLKENELEKDYCQTLNLCELVLTILAVSSSAAIDSPTIERVKRFARNSSEQDRLSQVSLLTIESELLQNMSEQRLFYEDVINELAERNTRLELHYK